MKLKLFSAIILSFILSSVVIASYGSIASSKPSYGFILTVAGSAFDLRVHEYVNIVLQVRGIGYGKQVMELYVRGGDLHVGPRETFSISRGWGILVPRYHYARLIIRVNPGYGGQTAVWNLRGWTGTRHGNTMFVSFYAKQVVLPLSGYPKLYNLKLSGAITLH